MPCIDSDNGRLPEVIIHEETGFSWRASDSDAAAGKIIELWKDEDKYHSFSKKAIAFVTNNFTVAHEVSRLKAMSQYIVNK